MLFSRFFSVFFVVSVVKILPPEQADAVFSDSLLGKEPQVKFNDFSALWEEEWGRGRMSWGGKGDWVVIGLTFLGLGVCQFIDCSQRMPIEGWFAYWLVGAGIFWILSGALRILIPRWRRGLIGLFAPGLLFGTMGIMLIKGWTWWPIIVLAVGLQAGITIIYNTMRKRMLEEKDDRI